MEGSSIVYLILPVSMQCTSDFANIMAKKMLVFYIHGLYLHYILFGKTTTDSPLIRQKDARIAKSLAKEIWYPIRVCTPHQILRYTLHGKGWELMLSEFPNSCFVFDEIHAYDPVITGFVIATAKFLTENNASCLFLSATMPDFIKKMLQDEIISYYIYSAVALMINRTKKLIEKKRHNLQIADGNILSNLDRILKAIDD